MDQTLCGVNGRKIVKDAPSDFKDFLPMSVKTSQNEKLKCPKFAKIFAYVTCSLIFKALISWSKSMIYFVCFWQKEKNG